MLARRSPRRAGFSLVELMTVVAVAAILASLAAPGFSTVLANSRIRTGADGIMAGLQAARAAAIQRGTQVSFRLENGTGWTIATVSPSSAIGTRPAGETGGNLRVTTLNDQDSLRFTALGAVAGYDADTMLTRITIAAPAGVSGADSLQIDIFAGGQARMCNLAVTAENDPRKC